MRTSHLRIGLLGAGFIFHAHAKALQRRSDVRLVAVCDRSRARADDAARKYGIPGSFESLEDMLKEDLDVVHVLVPADAHASAARQVLESGRHVFLEKPMALASSECQALVDLAHRNGLRLGVNHNFLFFSSYERLRQEAADGTLGRLDHVTVNWLYPFPMIRTGPFDNWILKEPKNLFFELGPHLMAYVVDLLGPLEKLQSSVSRPVDLPGGGRVYAHWNANGLRNGTSINVNLSILPGAVDRSIAVRGHGACVRSDVERDIHQREEPTGYGLVLDNFMTASGVAWQLYTNAGRNLLKAVRGTLRKGPEANPYGESIARSVGRFYDTLDAEPDRRLDGQFGTGVIRECERVVEGAGIPPIEVRRERWMVQPPRRGPTLLVTGGTGFIGRRLVRALVAKGHAVRVLTRSVGAAQIALAGLSVELVQGDPSDESLLNGALEGIEVVFHLARAVGFTWEDYYRQDVLTTKALAGRALAKGIKRFIYTGTIASHFSGDANQTISSETPLDPAIHRREHYARSKAACEALLLGLHREQGLPVVIFRPGIVIGKGGSPAHWGVGMFLSETKMEYWGDGRNLLPFVLVDDVAEALVLALDKEGLEGHSFLLTDEPLLSARDYVQALSNAYGTRVRAQPKAIWKYYAGDLFKEAVKYLIRHPNRKLPSYRDWASRSHRARYDSSKARQMLNWQPAGSRELLIERGIVEVVRDIEVP